MKDFNTKFNLKKKGPSPEEMQKELQATALKSMKSGMRMMEADAKMLVGVDTGRLRQSITSNAFLKKNSVVGTVGSNVEYAFFHSLQNPYLTTAVDMNLEKTKQNLKKDLEGVKFNV